MITIQIGQCGNQLGRALFDKLSHEEDAMAGHGPITESSFFRLNREKTQRVARAVLIDMEPKVVQHCLRATSAWQFDPAGTFTKQSGSGNNWAYGYSVHGAENREAMLDLLRREAERCDWLHGFLTLQSVAGGTGSGLGSLLTEAVADEFASALLLNAAVWPHASGEVIVQNYNALLTTACLADTADGIIALPNDQAHAICQRVLRISRPSFDDMNHVLATQLAAALLPVPTLNNAVIDPIKQLGQQLCTHAGFKLLDIKTVPQMPHRSKQFSTHMWSGVLKHLHQMQVANSALEEGIDWQVSLATEQGRSWNRAVGSLLLLRGRDAESSDVTAFHNPAMYAPWSLQPFQSYATTTEFNSYDKSATLISNSKALLPTLASTADKAYDMFSHGAYTHQYAKHGVDDAFFQEAFLRIDQVVQNYKTL